MISPALRVVCAFAGVILLAVAASMIRSDGAQNAEIAPVVAGLLLLAPAALGGGAARRHDLARIEEDARRFRLAALICFSIAVTMYALVLLVRGRGDLAQSAASLGAAFWLVAVVLLFLFAFYASRRRALARHED